MPDQPVTEPLLDCDRLSLYGGGCPIYNRQAQLMCLDSKSNG